MLSIYNYFSFSNRLNRRESVQCLKIYEETSLSNRQTADNTNISAVKADMKLPKLPAYFYRINVYIGITLSVLLLFFVYLYFDSNEADLLENTKRIDLVNVQRELPPKADYEQCTKNINERYDCHPEVGANERECEARGCCWMKADNTTFNVPYCFYPQNYKSYYFLNVTNTAFGLIAYMKRNYTSSFPKDVAIIKLIVKYETEDRLHFKFIDPNEDRFEPPLPDVPIIDIAPHNLSYAFLCDTLTNGFQIIRKSDKTIIFDSMHLQTMIFSDQFLQITSTLSTHLIYGLGEHRSSFLLSTNWTRFTFFNHDGVPEKNLNLYGSHPFHLNIESSGKANGIFLLNSNAMDIILQPTPAITYRTIGGILDFYVMLGPTPDAVIRQYTEIVGKPHMPPYWGLGFHLCRFGYKTLNETIKVMQRNIDAGIPLDTQWNDLDYMNKSNDFTYDKINFKGLPEFIANLHKNGMHYIPLIDPGISAGEVVGAYPPYDKGIEMDIFVKNSSGQPFIGKVWNAVSTVWPDFTNPLSVDYWTLMLKTMHKEIEFDGAWIDMNEPSNFLSGAFNGCPNNSYESPPYVPAVDGGKLNYKTFCMSANHTYGLHYNVHNLYGFVEATVTNFALAEVRGKRPMVISRSTFPGHGKYAGHWSGDVKSEWEDMKYSLPQLLSFSLFGIPLMGADICGFNGNTTPPLCNRWMQLGAFYPFARNHNTDDGIDQDPVALGPNVVLSSKKALSIRYSLLPYLYTLFWAAHVNGDTVARPLFFEFPNDKNTYGIDEQFMWGSALMIAPVLQEHNEWVQVYLPDAVWYDYHTYERMANLVGLLNVSAPLDTIPLFLRGGSILPQQQSLATTTESRKSDFQLLIALDRFNEAAGNLFWDDGDSLNTIEERKYSLWNFQFSHGMLKSEIVELGYDDEELPNVGVIKVIGIGPVNSVLVNNINAPFHYDALHKYLLIENLNVTLHSPFLIKMN